MHSALARQQRHESREFIASRKNWKFHYYYANFPFLFMHCAEKNVVWDLNCQDEEATKGIEIVKFKFFKRF